MHEMPETATLNFLIKFLAMDDLKQFCTFYLDHLLFGVEVGKVLEVIRYQEITPVPLAPPVVSGLINLRGQIVTALELRRRLEFKERDSDKLPMNVVVRTGEESVSLLVDEIGEVLDVEDDIFEAPPETLRGSARELIRGVYKIKERLLLVLDTEAVVTINGRNAQ